MNTEEIETIRISHEEMFPGEIAAGVTHEEITHCVNAVGDLADEQGLVVITPDVAKLLIRERAAARAPVQALVDADILEGVHGIKVSAVAAACAHDGESPVGP